MFKVLPAQTPPAATRNTAQHKKNLAQNAKIWLATQSSEQRLSQQPKLNITAQHTTELQKGGKYFVGKQCVQLNCRNGCCLPNGASSMVNMDEREPVTLSNSISSVSASNSAKPARACAAHSNSNSAASILAFKLSTLRAAHTHGWNAIFVLFERRI